MTYEELQVKIYEGDPIGHPDHPERVTLDETGLTILGGHDTVALPQGGSCLDHACDLHIKIEGLNFVLRYRDNADTPADEGCFGTEWSEPILFCDFEDMHGFIYSL